MSAYLWVWNFFMPCMAYFYFKTKQQLKPLRVTPVLNCKGSTDLLATSLIPPGLGTPQQIHVSHYIPPPTVLNLRSDY